MSGTPLELVQAINDAWIEGRAAEVLPELFTEDAVIVGPDLSRLAEGRDACIESYARFAEETDLIEFEHFDHRVDAFGGAAVVDYAYRAVYRRAGEELTDYGRDVILAVEAESGWQMAWR
ncbi:MAG: nuclear transport factor 2 family protein, partial [Solirubrobacterales bacterium]